MQRAYGFLINLCNVFNKNIFFLFLRFIYIQEYAFVSDVIIHNQITNNN